MRLVRASAEITDGFGKNTGWKEVIERCARVCYKSEEKIGPGSALKLIKKLIKRNHWTPFEFWSVTVKFICDRGISHELVRHRLCSFLQESSRYCDYGDGHVTFVIPFFIKSLAAGVYHGSHIPDPKNCTTAEVEWYNAMAVAEEYYQMLRQNDLPPQGARDVLPNSLKTEVICQANLREWHHIFTLRCSDAAHPDMYGMMRPLLAKFGEQFAPVFDDLDHYYNKGVAL